MIRRAILSSFLILLLPTTTQTIFALGLYEFSDNTSSLAQTLDRYEIIDIDLDLVLDQVRAHQPLRLQFYGLDLQLSLVLNPMRSPDYKAMVWSEEGRVEVPAGEPATYKGLVVGIPDSRVRLTIIPEWLSGNIRLPDTWFWIEPLSNYEPEAPRGRHVVYRTVDTNFVIGFEGQEPNTREPVTVVVPSLQTNAPRARESTQILRAETLEAGIILDGDYEFYNINPDTWRGRQASVLNNVEGIYEAEVDVTFDIEQHVVCTSSSQCPYDSTSAGTLLGQFRNEWNGESDPRDLAFLYTGKDLNGLAIGIAYLNSLGNPQWHYGLGQMIASGGYSASAYQKSILMAHEVGHIFNGVHGEADKWCTFFFIICWSWAYTIMYSPFHGDSMLDEFSDGSIDANHNNAQRIRTKAEDEL